MSQRKRGSGRQAPRPWARMLPATKIEPTDEQVARSRASAVRDGLDPDEVEAMMREPVEMWRNDRYVATVRRTEERTVHCISVRRVDRKPDVPWRHLQWIKNEIAGDEVEAIELFPAESRLVDTANQRWLWCLSPGLRVPVGFNERVVAGPEDAERYGAVQEPGYRPMVDGPPTRPGRERIEGCEARP